MTMKRMAAAALAMTLAAAPAMAQEVRGVRAGDWMIGLSGIAVIPTNGGDTSIGGTPNANTAIAPQLDFTYFVTPNVALNLIAATTNHQVTVRDVPGAGTLDLGNTWVLPPTLTLQYYPLPASRISPYLGAGINYTVFYGGGGPRSPGINNLTIDNSWGWALNAGVNYEIQPNWLLNFDVKYIFLSPGVSVNDGAVTGTADLNPWVIGAGVRYRF
jgi:outer membrane protein